MSGGLDSTYAARVLLGEGYVVEGAVLRMHGFTELSAARESASELGIPLHEIDCSAAFDERVVEPFIDEYISGRTPNPCAMCNPRVKFEFLCSFAHKNGFSFAATGHYCGTGYEDGRYFIKCAADTKKDQSYVLWGLTQDQLSILRFPLYSMSKNEIRQIASAEGLSAADRADSQEICFIPDGGHASFIEKRRGAFPEGDFIDTDGKKVGRHLGLHRYTIGQRKRLGISLGRPVYVTHIDKTANTVTVADAGEEYFSEMAVGGLNYQAAIPAEGAVFDAHVKVRYAAPAAPVSVEIRKDVAYAKFSAPLRAITPGQCAVFYCGGRILFGGTILP